MLARTKVEGDGEMETRKIQKVGASTLTISLPKGWVKQRNLKKGDQVFLVEDGEALKVLPASEAESRRKMSQTYVVDADLCDEPGMLERVIVGNYVLGRERLVVKSGGRLRGQHTDEIRRAARRLMGLGILEETPSRVLLQCSIDPSQYPVEPLLKRLYNLGVTMLNETYEALRSGNRELAEDAIKREDDADMIYWLLLRLLLGAQVDEALVESLGLRSRMEIPGDRTIAKELETFADTVEDMARSALAILSSEGERPPEVLRGMGRMVERVEHGLADAMAAFMSHDLKVAHRALNLTDGLREDTQAVRAVLRHIEETKVAFSYRVILAGLPRIAEVAKTIAVIAFNRYLERPSNLCRMEETA